MPGLWGYSSVGRAPALQAGGQEFESPYLHLIIQEAWNYQMKKTMQMYLQEAFSFESQCGDTNPLQSSGLSEEFERVQTYLENYTLERN